MNIELFSHILKLTPLFSETSKLARAILAETQIA